MPSRFGFVHARAAAKAKVYNTSNSQKPSTSPLGSSTLAASWSILQEDKKSGVGILLFAYGSQVTLQHFLGEAQQAAASFRVASASAANRIKIAVVTNNATVDKKLFDVHIKPRDDLLFAGDPCPMRRAGACGRCSRVLTGQPCLTRASCAVRWPSNPSSWASPPRYLVCIQLGVVPLVQAGPLHPDARQEQPM